MIVENQSEALGFLRRHAATLGPQVEEITTHASVVILAGDRAFKLKQAVRYPYLDYGSAERRLAACERELAINRRTAPDLYLCALRITREADGALAFDGGGTLVDAVVVMRRFPEETLLDRMAQRGELTVPLMTDLAGRIATFHRDAAVSREHGGAAGMRAVLDRNDRSLRQTRLFSAAEAGALDAMVRACFAQHARPLDQRRLAGKVRRCHGDLTLRNICVLDGVPTLFDAIEFDDTLATIDVLYDLAFLLMDLCHREQVSFANLVLNRYLDAADESDGIALVPFFLAVRAMIRAHVTAAAADRAGADAGPLAAEARAYADLGARALRRAPQRLVAVGGFSGTGKSTLAAALAPRLGALPGARVLSSDRLRKRLHGVSAETRLPEAAYRPEISEAVYATMRQEAARVLAAGGSVVLDAVFDRPADRAAVEAVAVSAGVPFQGLWLAAPTETLIRRIAARRNDPSDATAEVLRAQASRGGGDVRWLRLDATADPAVTVAAVLEAIG